jgi:DNA-binding transcriptional ArsR family regulator
MVGSRPLAVKPQPARVSFHPADQAPRRGRTPNPAGAFTPRGVSTSTRTADRALDLLDAVSERAGASLSELARVTGLSPATASRLLATLAARGLIRRDEQGRYMPGLGLMLMAARVLRGEPLYELAGPHLAELAQQTGETANLGVAVDTERALYLRHASAPAATRSAAARSSPTSPRWRRRSTAAGARPWRRSASSLRATG